MRPALFSAVLQGAAALCYQALFVRQLSLSLGAKTQALSLVVAVHLAGLGLGARLFAKVHQRVGARYAQTQITAAIMALFCGLLFSKVGAFPARLAQLLSAMALLAVATALGAAWPLLAKQPGLTVARVVGLNTLGGAAGALILNMLLLPALGVRGALLASVGLGVVSGLLGILYTNQKAKPKALETADPQLSATAAERSFDGLIPPSPSIFLGALAAVAGVSTLLQEIGWSRILSSMLSGTHRAHTATLTATLLGLGFGGLAIARPLAKSNVQPLRWFIFLQLGCGGLSAALWLALPWLNYQLRSLRGLDLSSNAGTMLELLCALLILGPPMACMGATLPLLSAFRQRPSQRTSRDSRFTDRSANSTELKDVPSAPQSARPEELEDQPADAGTTLGYLAAWSAAGNTVGALGAGFILIGWLGTAGTLKIAMLLCGLVALVASLLRTGSLLQRAPGLISLLALTFFAFALFASSMRRDDLAALSLPLPKTESYAEYRQKIERAKLLFFEEGPTGATVVEQTSAGRRLAIDGLPQGAIGPYQSSLDSVLIALLPLAHVKPKRAMLIGLGTGASAALLYEAGVSELKVVELEPSVVKAAAHYPKLSTKIRVIAGDGRIHLGRAERGSLDLIASMPSHPWVAAPLFTLEFFELAKSRLSQDGVFCAWFGARYMSAALSQMLLHTFAKIFEQHLIYYVPEISAFYLVGGKKPLTTSTARLRELAALPTLSGRLEPFFMPARLFGQAPKPSLLGLNTDDSALLELRAPDSSTTAPVRAELFLKPHIPPTLVPQGGAFFVETIEHLLGVPGGRIPDGPKARNIGLATRNLKAVSPWLSAGQRRYLEALLHLSKGEYHQARKGLTDPTLPEALGARARRLAALTVFGEARRAYLVKLPQTPDVLLALLDEHEPTGRAALRTAPKYSFARHPLGAFAQALTGSAAAPRPEILAAHVAPKLERTVNLGLLKLCANAPWPQFKKEADRCEIRRAKVRALRVRTLSQQGTALLKIGRLTQAADRFEEAGRLAPDDRALQERLLKVLILSGRTAQVRRATARLRTLGLSSQEIMALIKAARSKAAQR